ncbi:hypothetical protein [Siphonobacter sp. SORGH_AS_1065]|uniref:hypothetical protein n=1 Tax=Siphonobacter sp. SORGH_AS_1065 TaxID=3041795 RepID=UPI0027817AF3|nr:hypothetical protein [Siphonobacter sp. SORGH_AS_1065]MDQ1085714.1 hypothetical protein [Siphonobacter sp. SORGH_AS_1065]
MLSRPIYFLFFLISLTACKNQSRRSSVAVKFQPTSLKAVTIQEKITRQDELMLAYTLSVLDENNHLINTQNGAWGVQRTKKGDQFTAFPGLSIEVPPKSRVVATVVLMEIDDYSKAQKLVTDIRKYTGYAGAAASLLQVTELTNPVGYFLLSLQAAGLVLNNSNRIDPDDLLGSFSRTYTYEEVAKMTVTQTIPLKFSADTRFDSYEYQLNFQISRQSR